MAYMQLPGLNEMRRARAAYDEARRNLSLMAYDASEEDWHQARHEVAITRTAYDAAKAYHDEANRTAP